MNVNIKPIQNDFEKYVEDNDIEWMHQIDPQKLKEWAASVLWHHPWLFYDLNVEDIPKKLSILLMGQANKNEAWDAILHNLNDSLQDALFEDFSALLTAIRGGVPNQKGSSGQPGDEMTLDQEIEFEERKFIIFMN